jgi:Tfp pilus assembly protein PilZ
LPSAGWRPTLIQTPVTRDREHPRYDHNAAVVLLIETKQVHGHTNNVSRGGLCVTVGEAVVMGSDIDVDLSLVFEDDVRSDSLRMPARVVWCTPVDEEFQLGLSFRPHDAERAHYLTLFLRYLEEAREERKPPSDNVDERFR